MVTQAGIDQEKGAIGGENVSEGEESDKSGRKSIHITEKPSIIRTSR